MATSHIVLQETRDLHNEEKGDFVRWYAMKQYLTLV